jgi:hypothetical protein
MINVIDDDHPPGHFGGDPVAISRLAYPARVLALWNRRLASHSSCTSLETGRLMREQAMPVVVRIRADAVTGRPGGRRHRVPRHALCSSSRRLRLLIVGGVREAERFRFMAPQMPTGPAAGDGNRQLSSSRATGSPSACGRRKSRTVTCR